VNHKKGPPTICDITQSCLMLTVHTDTAVSTPLFTLTRAHETVQSNTVLKCLWTHCDQRVNAHLQENRTLIKLLCLLQNRRY